MSQEEDLIKKTLKHYIDGAKSGKGDDMKPAFHSDATIFGYIGDELFAVLFKNCMIGMIRMDLRQKFLVNLKVLKLYNQSLQFVWFQKIGQGLILPIFLHF